MNSIGSRTDRNDADRPIQLIYAGKAHPKDEPGKRFIKEIANLRHDPRFAGRVAFIEDYDINVCRHLIQGVDVWLNNPRRPLEASGTSGQKVVLNGGLNCSILDGWWAEAYNGNPTASRSATAPATSTTRSPTPAMRKRFTTRSQRGDPLLLRPRLRRPAQRPGSSG
jgi:hypothetical protein